MTDWSWSVLSPAAEPATCAWRQERLADSRLYLCTGAREREGDLEEFLRAALRGGVDIVQLREKGLEAQDELRLLEVFSGVAAEFGALVAANDRADIAHAASVDVLHLGQRDLTPVQARALVGPDVLVGRSSHDPAQGAAAAGDHDVAYYCTGPVWSTPTKPGRDAAGLGVVRAAAARGDHKPWFAIGGIENLDRLDEVVAAGATRVVVVRAITEAGDPEAAARALRERLCAT